MPPSTPAWAHIAAGQHGVIARRQLLGLGLTGSQARRHLANGQWRTVLPGVYLTHAGPAAELGNVWAALLYAGAGAALSHGTALWLDGVLDATPGCIHVTIAEARRVKPQPGLRVHRSAWTSESVHPGRSPTRTRIEHSVLDHLVTADEECVIDVLTRATQRRLTTPPRLADTLAGRTRHPHRSLINDVLADVEQGIHSPLERRFLRDVENAHGLPCGHHNRGEATATGTKYYDVRYRGWSTIVELDGRIAHPVEQAFRDLRRDNMAALSGDTVLRFGWRDVVGRPCEVAAQVTAALQGRGWPGTPRPCSDACDLRTAA